MKSWLMKFKISNALNDRSPLPPALGQIINQSEELRRFAKNSSRVDRALKSQLNEPEDCPQLHAAIMRAVRTAGHAQAAAKQPAWPRWIPVSGFGLLIVLGILAAFQYFSHFSDKIQHENLHSLAAAGSAIELGRSLVREVPAAAVSPLSDEMQKIDRNMTEAKQFLLASMP